MKRMPFLFPLLILLSGCPFPEDVEDYTLFSNDNFRVDKLWAPLDRKLTDHPDFISRLGGIKKQLCENPYLEENCNEVCSLHWKVNEADGDIVMDCWQLPRDIQQRFALRLSHPDRREVYISPYLSVLELMENSCRDTFFGSFYRPFTVAWVAEEPAHLEIQGSVRNCRADFNAFGAFSIGLRKTDARLLDEGSFVCNRTEVVEDLWSFTCSISPQSGIDTLYLDLVLNYRSVEFRDGGENASHPLPELSSTSFALADILAPEVLAQFNLPVPVPVGDIPDGGDGVAGDGADDGGDELGGVEDGVPPVPDPGVVPAPVVDPAPIADKNLNDNGKAAADSAGDRSSGGGCSVSPRAGRGVFMGWLIPVGLYFLWRRRPKQLPRQSR